jgi:Flp pilus assembly pilin Flp
MAPTRREALDSGAVAAEYGVLLGFVTLLIAVGVGLFGNTLAAFMSRIAATIARVLGV